MPAKSITKPEIPTVASMFIDGFLSTKFISQVTKIPKDGFEKRVKARVIKGEEYDLAERNGEPELPVVLIAAPYIKKFLLDHHLPIPEEIEKATHRYIARNQGHLARLCAFHDYPADIPAPGQEYNDMILSKPFQDFTGIFTVENAGFVCGLDPQIFLRFIKRRELKYEKLPDDINSMHLLITGVNLLAFLTYWKYEVPPAVVTAAERYKRLKEGMKGRILHPKNLALIKTGILRNLAHATSHSPQPASLG